MTGADRREYWRAYHAKNAERIRAQKQAYYLANRDHILARTTEYQAAHREQSNGYSRASRQRRKSQRGAS